ncbi:MAG: thioredoxin domain-containing protein [Candidatus Woesearchaeota archaeon]
MEEHEHHERKVHEHKDNESVKLKKVTIWKTVSAVLAVLLLISIYTNGFGISGTSGNGNTGAAGEPQQAQQRQDPSDPNPQPSAAVLDNAGLADDDDVKGDINAPVTIVEFSDYECPFCARFYSQTLGQIDDEYIKTGKAKLIYRDFPLGFHAQAQKAAEAAECAGEQGKYYEMHDKLFEDGVAGGLSSFKKYASDLGLDTAAFNTCLDSGEMADEVKKDFQDGQKAGVTGTPAFFINGRLVVGAQPFSVFKQAIDAELAN